MSEIGVMNIAIIILVLIVLSIFVFLIFKIKNEKSLDEEVFQNEPQKNNQISLDDLIYIVSNQRSSRGELLSAATKFIQNFSFPKKEIDEVAPKGAKVYLNFILLLASHKNTDAKLIAYLNKELKKRNPNYKKEIDIYEDQGIEQRKNRN